MNYTNIDILSSVVSHWIRPMGDTVVNMLLNDKLSGINEWAKKIFPLPSNYSIANDISFLFAPTVDAMIVPSVRNMLINTGISDADIPKWANDLVNAMEEEVESKGEITLFNTIVFHKDDIDNLRSLIEKNIAYSCDVGYKVVE